MNPPIANTFSPLLARQCCQLSADVYDAPSIASPLILRDTRTDTLAAVFVRGDKTIVAFRGTADLRNWLTDLDCAKTLNVFGPGRIHAGFRNALYSVWHELFDRLRGNVTRDVIFTGHSLGGALAMLAAGWLSDEAVHDESVPRVAGVYTFGQPRVGDATFCRAYDCSMASRGTLGQCTWRVVHGDDVVARVPWLLGRFRHPGHEVMFYDRVPDDYEIDLPWPIKLSADIPLALRELLRGKLALLDEHHINNYLALFNFQNFLPNQGARDEAGGNGASKAMRDARAAAPDAESTSAWIAKSVDTNARRTKQVLGAESGSPKAPQT